MKNFAKFSIALLALVALACAPAAKADTFTYSITGTGISGSGLITATLTGTSGIYDITAISGTITDSNYGASGTVTLLGGSPGAQRTSPDGNWYYDNLLFMNGSQFADNASGWLLSVGGEEFNLWGNGAFGSGYTYGASNPGQSYGAQLNLNVSGPLGASTPEPGSLFLLGTGLLGLALVLFRKAKKPVPTLQF